MHCIYYHNFHVATSCKMWWILEWIIQIKWTWLLVIPPPNRVLYYFARLKMPWTLFSIQACAVIWDVPHPLIMPVVTYINTGQYVLRVWLGKDKGAIYTCASARDKFGSWCASSHAPSQSPSTITGVPVAWLGRLAS